MIRKPSMTKFISRRWAAGLALCATIAACSVLSAAPAKAESWDGYDRRILAMNQSQKSIVDLRVSNVGDRDWGPDRVGVDTLAPGESGILNTDDGEGYCRYDFRYRLSDGTVLVSQGMNVCDSVGVVLR